MVRGLRSILIQFLILVLICAPIRTVFAGVSIDDEEDEELVEIPTEPSKPPIKRQIKPPEIPRCERYFVFEGKRLECDSNVGRDAGRLRPIMKDVPSALIELNAYQQNRQKIKLAA